MVLMKCSLPVDNVSMRSPTEDEMSEQSCEIEGCAEKSQRFHVAKGDSNLQVCCRCMAEMTSALGWDLAYVREPAKAERI